MSKKHTDILKCPECGKESEFTVWDSVNAEIDPEAKADLLSGKLFQFQCPHCNATRIVDYGMLYHQMDRQLMIRYSQTEDDAQKAIDLFQKMSDGNLPGFSNEMAMDTYTFRIVDSMQWLREKAFIFDNDLDDRVIELMKLFIFARMDEEMPEVEVKKIWLDTVDDLMTFVVLKEDGKLGRVPFDQQMYDSVEHDIIDPADDGNLEYFVNTKWALDYLNSQMEKKD